MDSKLKEKETSSSNSVAGDEASTVNYADQSLDTILQRLPTKHRQEILKQYDLPDVNLNLFSILRYATPAEFAMQIVGSICAVAAGWPLTVTWRLICRRRIAVDDYYAGRLDKHVWRFHLHSAQYYAPWRGRL
jgi:hypothetical protein